MFQILALDGGGIKGVFSASLLAALEEDLGNDVASHFDLIAGTSTGGLIALGLGLGLSPKRIVEFYATQGAKIFPRQLGWGGAWSVIARKYSQKRLKAALQETFGTKTLADSKKRLVIPSFSLGDDDVYLFRTAHHADLNRDYRVEAWRVGLATSAAPTYFPVCRHVDGLRLIDGGVWANNPSMVALIEAHCVLKVPLEDIRIFSLGPSEDVVDRPRRLNWGGKAAWGLSAAAIDVILRGQSLAAAKQAQWLLGQKNYWRVSPKVPPGVYSLDGVRRAEDLVSKANFLARPTAKEFKERFGDHTAPPFTSMKKVVAK